MGYTIRYVTSGDEISEVLNVMAPWFVPPVDDYDYVLNSLLDHFPEYRDMMIIAEKDGRVVGGALGFGGKLGIIAVCPEDRMKGLARRLLQTFEVGAMGRGVTMISLGARETAKKFYERVGYGGKSSMHKGLPLPGKSLDWRLRKIEAEIGDLESGQELDVDESGRIPPLSVSF